jgi:hypothetical protein
MRVEVVSFAPSTSSAIRQASDAHPTHSLITHSRTHSSLQHHRRRVAPALERTRAIRSALVETRAAAAMMADAAEGNDDRDSASGERAHPHPHRHRQPAFTSHVLRTAPSHNRHDPRILLTICPSPHFPSTLHLSPCATASCCSCSCRLQNSRQSPSLCAWIALRAVCVTHPSRANISLPIQHTLQHARMKMARPLPPPSSLSSPCACVRVCVCAESDVSSQKDSAETSKQRAAGVASPARGVGRRRRVSDRRALLVIVLCQCKKRRE